MPLVKPFPQVPDSVVCMIGQKMNRRLLNSMRQSQSIFSRIVYYGSKPSVCRLSMAQVRILIATLCDKVARFSVTQESLKKSFCLRSFREHGESGRGLAWYAHRSHGAVSTYQSRLLIYHRFLLIAMRFVKPAVDDCVLHDDL